MDKEKYRKWYLLYNWGNNEFIMVKCKSVYNLRYIHLLIKNGTAYWLNTNELCIGYILINDHNIFRPVFSYKRQQFLDNVNTDIKNYNKFWNRIKSRYYYTMAHKKELPLEIIEKIVTYIY